MRPALLSIFISLLAVAAIAAIDITDPTFGPSASNSSPIVASNGTVFLTLWTFGSGSDIQIRGSITSSRGQLLTPVSIPVIHDGALAGLAAAGENFLVAWGDQTGAPRLSIVDGAGGVVREVPYPVQRMFRMPKISVSGDHVLMVDANDAFFPPGKFIGTMFTLDGTLVRDGIEITSGYANVDVSATNDGFAVATADSATVYLQRIARDGTGPARISVGSSTPRAGTVGYTEVAVAAAGNDSLVAWTGHIDALSPTDTLSWTVVSPDRSSEIHRIATPAGKSLLAAMAVWTGSAYLVVTPTSSESSLITQIAPSGEVAGASSPLAMGVLAVANAEKFVYVASSTGDYHATVIGETLLADSTLLEVNRDVLSVMAESQLSPALASDGLDFAAVWNQTDATTNTITAGRFTMSGGRLDPSGFAIASAAPRALRIAHGSSTYLVVWRDDTRIVGRRFTNTGVMIDQTPIIIRTEVDPWADVDVVWGAGRFLVVWPNGMGFDGSFIGADGNVSALAHVTIDTVSEWPADVHVAWDGTRFLLAWAAIARGSIICTCTPPLLGVRAARLSADGTLLDRTPLVLTTEGANSLSVAASDSDFAVVMAAYYAPYRVVAFHLDPDHEALSLKHTTPIARWFTPMSADVTWDGRDYVIATSRNTRGISSPYPWQRPGWLGVTRLAPSGFAHDYSVVRADASSPAIAFSASGAFAVVASVTSTETDTNRVRAYFESDFTRLPEPPSAPINVTVQGSPDNQTVSWTPTSTNHDGFLVELVQSRSTLVIAVLPSDQTSMHITEYGSFDVANSIRVSAFNAAGTSSQTLIAPPIAPRRRAAG